MNSTFAKFLKSYLKLPISNGFLKCFFCGQNECNNCKVKNTDNITLGEIWETILDNNASDY